MKSTVVGILLKVKVKVSVFKGSLACYGNVYTKHKPIDIFLVYHCRCALVREIIEGCVWQCVLFHYSFMLRYLVCNAGRHQWVEIILLSPFGGKH